MRPLMFLSNRNGNPDESLVQSTRYETQQALHVIAHCSQLAHRTGSKWAEHTPLKFLSSHIGFGWDSLQNIPTYPVLELNFSQCKTTEDGEYLIPNGVRTTKIESRRIRQVEDHHDNFRSVLQARQNSITVGAEIPIYGAVSIGGSLSAEFINIKKTMTRLNTDLNTLSLVYEAYEMVANDGQMKVIDSFQHEIQGIADALSSGMPQKAEYLAQMTVKQYGTHFVTKSIMGVSLEQLDYVESDDGSSFSNEGTSTSAGIGIGVSGVSVGVSGTNSKNTIKETERSSRIRHTDEFRKGNFTLMRNTDSNGAEIYTNFVVEDIAGLRFHVKRLSEVLSTRIFPQYNWAVLEAVKEKLDSAIIAYYQANIIRGCTNPKAINFNFQANDDDGSCKIVPVPYFGGIYRSATFKFVDQQNSWFGNVNMRAVEQNTRASLDNNPGYRDSFFADNPITGQPSCPIGFESILLYESNITLYFKEKSWFSLDQEDVWDGNTTVIRIRNADRDVSFRIHRNCKVYWCKRDRNLPPPKDSDIALFGGTYIGFRDDLFANNPITGQPSCPIGFESVLLYEINSTVYFKEKPWFGLDHEDGNATAIRTLNADNDISFRIHRNVKLYWCKRDRNLSLPKDSDIALFGGVYTDYRDRFFADNPITGQPSCPIGFESVLLYEINSTVYFKEKPWFGLDHEDGNATAIEIHNADRDVSFRLHRKYGVYWCKRDRNLPPPKDSDIALFGGTYIGLY
ncbi:hypothetical protein WR25_04636 [Diploscapter pachys]|uniref:MACPF domain-containing protein n=1 Tax=Diploscapter pachys TaxID=2018661 RepID=A0A2A2KIM2_9BILA|nr:hypothetical protein WR25_04636 [Diploscapter pachys]